MIWFHRASDFSQRIQTVAIAIVVSAIDVTNRTFDNLYQSYTRPPSCAHEHNGHALCIEQALSIGVATVANKTICDARGQCSLTHTEANLSPNLIDSLCLRVAQTPTSRDIAIFVLMTTMTTMTTDYPLRMRVGSLQQTIVTMHSELNCMQITIASTLIQDSNGCTFTVCQFLFGCLCHRLLHT